MIKLTIHAVFFKVIIQRIKRVFCFQTNKKGNGTRKNKQSKKKIKKKRTKILDQRKQIGKLEYDDRHISKYIGIHNKISGLNSLVNRQRMDCQN